MLDVDVEIRGGALLIGSELLWMAQPRDVQQRGLKTRRVITHHAAGMPPGRPPTGRRPLSSGGEVVHGNIGVIITTVHGVAARAEL